MSEITSLSFPYNYALFCSLVAWASAQLGKLILSWIANGHFDRERLVGAGGMPSGHSAMVCSLAIAIGKSAGISSPVFAVSVILAAIVMYDALGVRRSSGEQAKLLNRVVETLDLPELKQAEIKKKIRMASNSLDDSGNEDEKVKKLKEKIGHTPIEVVVGAAWGIVVALLIPVV